MGTSCRAARRSQLNFGAGWCPRQSMIEAILGEILVLGLGERTPGGDRPIRPISWALLAMTSTLGRPTVFAAMSRRLQLQR